MDISTQANSLKALNSLIFRRSPVVRVLNPYEYRPAFSYCGADCPLESCSPESVGISSEHIKSFYGSLMSEPSLDIQNVLIARNGKIISRGCCFPYRNDIPHISHSLCKSLVSLAVGILFDRKILTLDEKVIDIFPEMRRYATSAFKSKLTVRHLLTMTSGATFNELGSVTARNWLKTFFRSGAKFTPGKQFDYNSMNTYVLSAIVCKKSKVPLSDFIAENIFSVLGINKFYWEKCPMGIEKGGWGLYMYPEDVLKLGMLLLQNGIYKNKRIISEKWIRLATKPWVKTPALTGNYDYGFQMWINEKHGEVLFNGMFGQNLHIFTRTKTLVSVNAGNGDIFQRCRSYSVIQRYFGKNFRPASVLEDFPESLEQLRSYEKCMFKKNSVEQSIVTHDISDPCGLTERTNNSCYITNRKEAIGVSIFPSLAQAVHNTFSNGIEKISFSLENGAYYVTFHESAGTFKLNVGFDKAEYQTVYYNSEPFAVAVYGEAVTDEDKRDVLKLTIAYTELPNKRTFKIYFSEKSVTVKCSETPGYDFAVDSISTIASDAVNGAVIKNVGTGISREVKKRTEYFLKPTIHASRCM